jgi:succinate-semialdehyde dehydrogenase/glutarate-semialdehyde dehydrogenase
MGGLTRALPAGNLTCMSARDATAAQTGRPGAAHIGDPQRVPVPIADVARRLVTAVITGARPETVTTRAPFTDAELTELPLSTVADVATAYDAARHAQQRWARRPVSERAAVFLRLHDLVLDRQDEGLDIVQLETGKARRHAFEELLDVALNARHYGRAGRSYLRTTRHGGIVPLLSSAYELRHPKGVVGIVSPWNYPLTLAVSDAIPAFIAGNAVVHKPDTQTALTALWARSLAVEAGLPEALWQVVLGDGPTIGGAVVDGGDYVCFTGSTRVGREVAEKCGRRLVGASLELGGKNPMIVLADADVDRAAEGAVRDCFANSGQLCVSMERMYVVAGAFDAFVDRFVQRVKGLELGTSLDYQPDMGSLISGAQLARVAAHVDDAVSKGATVLAGGRARPDIGPYFYEPTVLTGVTEDMRLCREETFGPVVAVREVTDVTEAIALANDSEFGLNASVWTRDVAYGRRIAAQIETGTVSINETYAAAWGATSVPMGGRKSSGLGRRHGREGILKYTEPQSIAVQRLQGFGPPAFVSQDAWAKGFTAALRALKVVGRR